MSVHHYEFRMVMGAWGWICTRCSDWIKAKQENGRWVPVTTAKDTGE